MLWRKPTKEDTEGKGDHRYLVDIIPDTMPHQSTTDGDALIRIGKRGWSWDIYDLETNKFCGEVGYADTREEAVGAALDALAKLRS